MTSVCAPIRVLVCDDSPTMRAIIVGILRRDQVIEVAGLAADGKQAADALAGGGIDVVLLDVEMPVMDGISALPVLLGLDPALRVIMISSLTVAGGAITMRALQAGAADYVTKPGEQQTEAFAAEILAKVKQQGQSRRGQAANRRGTSRPGPRFGPCAPSALTLRSAPFQAPMLLAIGSSTGGPNALFALFRALDKALPVPIVVTQHMPPLFTRSLADHLARQGRRDCHEAHDNQLLVADQILVAPGDRHMAIVAAGSGLRVRLTDDPPENSCRPSVDTLLRTASLACQGRVLTVILTGMGQDGLLGARCVVEAGGCVLAQDEASSVVWGMPGAVARAGLCHAVLPIDELAMKVMTMLNLRP